MSNLETPPIPGVESNVVTTAVFHPLSLCASAGRVWAFFLAVGAFLWQPLVVRARRNYYAGADHIWYMHRSTDAEFGQMLAALLRVLGGHVTPHGMRSYFVTQARESGLSDAEIASLIGDKTGPAIIALTYGDVRSEHLLKQAKRIRLTASQPTTAAGEASSNTSSNTSTGVTTGCTWFQQGAKP